MLKKKDSIATLFDTSQLLGEQVFDLISVSLQIHAFSCLAADLESCTLFGKIWTL